MAVPGLVMVTRQKERFPSNLPNKKANIESRTVHCTVFPTALHSVPYCTVQCTLLHCTVRGSALHSAPYSTAQCTLMHCTVHRTALHCTKARRCRCRPFTTVLSVVLLMEMAAATTRGIEIMLRQQVWMETCTCT